MRSSFFEYNVAMTGLFTAKGALEVVGNNVSNATTKGYSRQYAEIRAHEPLALYTGKGMVGTGSGIYSVRQHRSFYLDKKYWTQTPTLGQYGVKNQLLASVEATFTELSGLGVKGAFDKFFQTVSDLHVSSGDGTYRTNVLQSGQTLTRFISNAAESLKQQQLAINSEVKTVVEIINSLGQQITSLNKQIYKYELAGDYANELRDDRARLVDELSKYVNVEVDEVETNDDFAKGKFPNPEDRNKSDKRFSVSINGNEFVSHFDMSSLTIVERSQKVNPTDVHGLYDIYFANSSKKFDIYSPSLSGELKGLIDTRDGNNNNCGTGTFKYTGGQTITLPISRLDYLETGGVLTIQDTVTGIGNEYYYKSYTYDQETKMATFEIDDTKTPLQLKNDNNRVYSLSVGKTTVYKGIPHYMNKLNHLVRTFAKAMNEGVDGLSGHKDGYDGYGKKTNELFFTDGIRTQYGTVDEITGEITYIPINYNNITAENFQINPSILLDPRLLAAAKGTTSDKSDNEIIKDLMSIKDYKSLFKEGKLEDYVIGISVELGIDIEQANNFDKSYTESVALVNNQRRSVSGVDLDEESIDMVRFQQLYIAAAKLINVIDNIYDTLINRVGV